MSPSTISTLPRNDDSRDVSTQILSKIAETPTKALTAQLASSWLASLESTIRQTKCRIHERLSNDLPNFDRQLSTSVSIQERLRSLSHNVDVLHENVSTEQSGLIPKLVNTLSEHSALVHRTSNAHSEYQALDHLLKCRGALQYLHSLVHKAELADATRACASLDELLNTAPDPLPQSAVLAEFKRKSAAVRNGIEEQLLDAYMRSVTISASEISIKTSVQAVVSPHLSVNTTIDLASILASMSPIVLSQNLSTLRRDIIAHCIDYVLKQPIHIDEGTERDITGAAEHKLYLQRAPPDTKALVLHISQLIRVMRFLNNNLFSHFPPTERTSFPLSLCTPFRTALLNHLLLPNLPSTLPELADYLKVTERAVQAENEIVVTMFKDTGSDRTIQSWVDSVGLHYERKRRAELLDKARVIAVSILDENTAFRVDVPLLVEDHTAAVSSNGHGGDVDLNGHAMIAADDLSGVGEPPADDWGFDDANDEDEQESPREPELARLASPSSHSADDDVEVDDDIEEESGDAWGWNDDSGPTPTEDDSAWDDSWDEKPPASPPVPPSPAPKHAKGLEKKSMGGKSVPPSPAFPPPPPQVSVPTVPKNFPTPPASAPPPKPINVLESYLVSGRTKELLQLIENVLREGAELVTSGLLTSNTHTGSTGNILMQAAPMALELFRALVPVAHASVLKQSAKEPMRFSNDCMYIGQEIARVVRELSGPGSLAKDKLEDGLERLKVLAESWFEDAIAQEEKTIDELLEGARGFIDTTQQDRYDECENAINEVLRRIRRVSPQWKAVLAKSRYYDALGSLVEAALARILGDVLALHDITEVESHRLSELCRILNALEGLFVEDPERPSFVVSYVPSWLKFSYLSELLEASIADISYLFEEGALVDFEIEELVKLVKALFADTPLRSNTVNKLMQGHPMRS